MMPLWLVFSRECGNYRVLHNSLKGMYSLIPSFPTKNQEAFCECFVNLNPNS